MGKTVTSMKIDEVVYKKFRMKCIEKDIEYAEGMEEALTEWIKNG